MTAAGVTTAVLWSEWLQWQEGDHDSHELSLLLACACMDELVRATKACEVRMRERERHETREMVGRLGERVGRGEEERKE